MNTMGDRRNASNNQNYDNPPPHTFTYPIAIDVDDKTIMKNISLNFLPTFRGFSTKDPDQFLFEFKVLCQTYDYKNDNQKLNIFPSALKGSAMY